MLVEIDLENGQSFLVHKDLVVRVNGKKDKCTVFVKKLTDTFISFESYEDTKGYDWWRQIMFLKELNRKKP